MCSEVGGAAVGTWHLGEGEVAVVESGLEGEIPIVIQVLKTMACI